MKTLLIERNANVTTVTLNRPDVHNAFNEDLTRELHETFAALNADTETRVVVLTGAGKSFSAGADLNYMKSAAGKSSEQNVAESLFMAKMLTTIDEVNKPVIGMINGAALGGGMGLVSCCDIVLAHEGAQFGFSEVKLGMAPSVISPFVVRKMGVPQARRYFLTGERFNAAEAKRLNIATEVYADDNRDALLNGFLKHFLANGPQAMAEIKHLLRMNWQASGDALAQFTAAQISRLRASAEGQEGIRAFFEKRAPGFAK